MPQIPLLKALEGKQTPRLLSLLACKISNLISYAH